MGGHARGREPFMNAIPLLATLLEAVHEEHLDVVLIGHAAAAMQGAPATSSAAAPPPGAAARGPLLSL